MASGHSSVDLTWRGPTPSKALPTARRGLGTNSLAPAAPPRSIASPIAYSVRTACVRSDRESPRALRPIERTPGLRGTQQLEGWLRLVVVRFQGARSVDLIQPLIVEPQQGMPLSESNRCGASTGGIETRECDSSPRRVRSKTAKDRRYGRETRRPGPAKPNRRY